jgi:hypothetical protein
VAVLLRVLLLRRVAQPTPDQPLARGYQKR